MSAVEEIRAAIIGGSESGKTSLAVGMARGLWNRHQLRSIVFYPWLREQRRRKPINWGVGAWVTDDFNQWKRVATSVENCAAIWDEVTTNGGRERDNVELLSEIRGRHPVLICIGHYHASILPGMRVNLTGLYLAAADPDDAAEWAKTMKDPAVKQATGLQQYEFLKKRPFKAVEVLRYSKAQLDAGILP